MLVVGVFFACAVTLVAVVMVVAVLDLVLCFWLTVDFMGSPPPPFSLFFLVQKWGEGGYHALIGIVRFRLRMGGGEVSIPFVFLTKIVCRIGF